MRDRLLFICKKRNGPYGYGNYGLQTSASFVAEALEKKGYATKVVSVNDSNCIDREVHQYKPDIVIIEAIWVPPYKFKELFKLHPKVIWINRIHSKAPFLAMEGIAFQWLNEYKQFYQEEDNKFYISCNNRFFNHELTHVLEVETLYLPNVYNTKNIPEKAKINHNDEFIDIGCFSAIRPFKNQLIQAIASIMFANKQKKILRFHINAGRLEQQGENVLKNLRGLFKGSRHQLVEHPWLPHDKFLEVVQDMDMGLQVSLSESFNIVTADFVEMKKPIIVSEDVDWINPIFQVNCNSAAAIADRLSVLYWLNWLHLHFLNTLALWWHNKKAIKVWTSTINLLLH